MRLECILLLSACVRTAFGAGGEGTNVPVQYQHFIPQFILRTFSDRPGANSVHIFNTTSHKYGRIETAKVLGGKNMYARDFLAGDRDLENALGKLECYVAPLLKQLRTMPTTEDFTMNAAQRFRLKLFLFTLNFRQEYRLQFYTNRNFDPLTMASIRDYMDTHDIPTFRESWRRDLETLVSMQDGWKQMEKRARLYPPVHAEWVMHLLRNIAVWRIPASSDRSFIVTDHSEGLWEGLDSTMIARQVFVVGPKTAIVMETIPGILRRFGALEQYKTDSIFRAVPYEHNECESLIIKAYDVDDKVVDGVNKIALEEDCAHGIIAWSAKELLTSFRVYLTYPDIRRRETIKTYLAALETQYATIPNKLKHRVYFCQYCKDEVRVKDKAWEKHLLNHEKSIALAETRGIRRMMRQDARDAFNEFVATAIEK